MLGGRESSLVPLVVPAVFSVAPIIYLQRSYYALWAGRPRSVGRGGGVLTWQLFETNSYIFLPQKMKTTSYIFLP
jgi:hypothetical protein